MKGLSGYSGKQVRCKAHCSAMLSASTNGVNTRASGGACGCASGIPKTSRVCGGNEEMNWQGGDLQRLLKPECKVMDTEDLHQHLVSIGLSDDTVKFVLDCAKNAPVRQMKGHGGSTRNEVSSRKMGRTHVFESLSVELPFGMLLERDSDVLAYFPQPCQIPLKVGIGAGSNRSMHTPDVLVVRRAEVAFEEWKSANAYNELAEKKPNRYTMVDGVLHDFAAEAYAESKGISYRIRSRSEIPELLIENLEYLEDYVHPSAKALTDLDRDRIGAVLAANPSISITEALECESSLSIDDWMKAIVDGHVTVDLANDRLAVHSRAFLYRDDITMEFAKAEREAAMQRLCGTETFRYVDGMTFLLDGRWFQMITHGDTTAFLKDDFDQAHDLPLETLEKAFRGKRLKVESIPEIDGDSSEARRRLCEATHEELLGAKKKLEAVHMPSSWPGLSQRTLRHWSSLVKNAEAGGIEPLFALLPRRWSQGNRTVRYEAAHLDAVRRIIRKDYFQLHRPSKVAAYERYRLKLARLRRRFKTHVWEPISRQSFGLEIERIRDTGANFDRFGKRAGAAMRPTYVALAYQTSVHGVRPFHVVHIDHTQADVEIMSEHDGKSLGRPWLSIASDADRRYVLAWSISFRSPDTATTLGLIRDVVRRHGRLPAILVLDNGADFRSASMAHFCTVYSIIKRMRPPGQPRAGSVCERLFGTVNTEFLHRLRGNTDLMKKVRTVTGSAFPEKNSRWSLRTLKVALGFFIDDVYHKDQHPALLTSPAEAFESGMRQHGRRHSRQVNDDQTLEVLTSPFVDRQTRILCRRTGVKVDETYYHALALQEPRFDGQKCLVRQHPSNIDIVWVKVGREWIKAYRSGKSDARGLNAWEADLYATELLARKRISAKEAKSPDSLRRKVEMCSLIEELEKAGHALFRRLREEGLITPPDKEPARAVALTGKSSTSAEPVAVADQKFSSSRQPAAATQMESDVDLDFEDFCAPL